MDITQTVSRLFEELDFRSTPIGDISLRRRYEPRVGHDVFEIKLGEEFLMSSLVATSEIALADLGLEACRGKHLDVAVGGLGLGYTADAVLNSKRVDELIVIEALEAVIDWHIQEFVPLGNRLTSDNRCTLSKGDFFACADDHVIGLDPAQPGRRFDAILVDIDHTPDALLNNASAAFYTTSGLARLAKHLKPGGVFGLWSNVAPDEAFVHRLKTAFPSAWAVPVDVPTPMGPEPLVQTVYLARTAT